MARTFFLPSDLSVKNSVKGIETVEDADDYLEYSTSYFAYRGYIRLYQFYSSAEFLRLERAYGHLHTLDVARCFDSIYTHTLAWAVTSKDFAKANLRCASFAKAFDKRMQFGNEGETNGILIGPEISRIFAEIILQRVDLVAEASLREAGIVAGVDYEVRRYVDDILIFTVNPKIAGQVYERYSDALKSVNLTANTAKSFGTTRPFITPKSKSILEATTVTNELLAEVFSASGNEAKLIWKPARLAAAYIRRLKLVCLANGSPYDDIASYVISILTRRIVEFVQIHKPLSSMQDKEAAKSALLAIVDVLLFLYSVAPSVTASYTLGRALIVLVRFVREKLPESEELLAGKIAGWIAEFLQSACRSIHEVVGSHISLEALNVLLLATELGTDYLLGEDLLKAVFIAPGETVKSHNWTYFELVCCVYSMGAESQYENFRSEIWHVIDRKLAKLEGVERDAQLALLVLDMSVCPYVDPERKQMWVMRLCKVLKTSLPSEKALSAYCQGKDYWFVNWSHLDILNVLQKKELSPSY